MSLTTITTRRTVTDLLESFADAPSDRLDADYQELVDALWDDGQLTEAAPAAVPSLVARLEHVDDARKGRLAVLLGLLAEADHPAADHPAADDSATGGAVAAAVRQGLDRYLELWGKSPTGQPLSLALQYLVAHFPQDRDRVLAVAAGLELDPDDRSRLDRALQQLDPRRPVLGRVFPSPAVWTFDEEESNYDQGWIGSLSAEQIAATWRHDTRTVLGHNGAKAYWAVRNGAPAPVTRGTLPPRQDTTGTPSADSGVDLFARHAEAFRCPSCGSTLEFGEAGAWCAGCASTYPIARGILNLTELRGGAEDFLFKLANIPSMGLFYETYARPAFLRVSGSNWGRQVSLSDEDAYIAEHVRPVDGPVLDLGAGAGRWTEVVGRTVGAERLVALDMSAPMLSRLREVVPAVPAVMTSARTLPFGDATLGAVVCWNALQAFPDDAAAAIAEVGRCLRPGGTFAILTFRRPDDRIYRYFQSSHYFPQHGNGLQLLDLDELKTWLADAGLEIRHEWGPGTFVFITAERPQSAE
jgi:SAM-dependent methyltransferase